MYVPLSPQPHRASAAGVGSQRAGGAGEGGPDGADEGRLLTGRQDTPGHTH